MCVPGLMRKQGGGGEHACSMLIINTSPWKCIEFLLAQGQSVHVPLFTLFQAVSRKQAAK